MPTPVAADTIEEAPCCVPSHGQGSLLATEAEALAARFKALADPNRLRILSIVSTSENAETCVCDLSEPLGLGQPTVSHHLKIMVEAGLLPDVVTVPVPIGTTADVPAPARDVW